MKLLVLRLSAFGDVAMTVPVIDSLARQYPSLEITVLSRSFVAPLFAQMPANVQFKGVNVKQYKGLGGLLRLFHQLQACSYDAVADLHDVLRTRIVRLLFNLSGVQTAHIDKGRKGKKELVRPKHKVMQQQPSSFTRYEEVFRHLGYPVKTTFLSIYGNGRGDESLFKSIASNPEGRKWIGIAPFAAHAGKILPEAVTESLIQELSAHKDWQIFIFGGGKVEQELSERWATSYPNVQSVAGKLNLEAELALMSYLNVMISMDSANMHLASLVGTTVVSIWGATHPFAGFMGWRQMPDNAIQAELPCRPCSIFGNKPCLRGDYACLTCITPQMIVQHVQHLTDL